MKKSVRFENEIWREYIDALRRLESLVEDESGYLSGGDWQGIIAMMGKIENAQITLRHHWQKLSNAGLIPQDKGETNDDSPERQEASTLLQRILKKKSVNEELIQQEMARLRKGIAKLKKTRDSHIKYLEQGKKNSQAMLEIKN